MSTFTLKIIAIISMLVDHVTYVFPEVFPFELRGFLGRLAFPIFAYLIAVGVEYTKSPLKYMFRLFLFAIISEPFFDLALKGGKINYLSGTNIFFTLFLGACAIYIFRKIYEALNDNPKNKYILWVALLPLPVFPVIANIIDCDYRWYGVLLIISFYFIRKLKSVFLRIVPIIIVTCTQYFVFVGMNTYFLQYFAPFSFIAGMLAASVLLCFYNEKQGFSKAKWLFYIFYPGHLLVLYLITLF